MGKMDVEIEVLEDSINAGVKAGDRITVEVDIDEANEECFSPFELTYYITELANDELKKQGREKGSWLHYTNVRILDEEDVVKAIKGEKGWGEDMDFSTMTPDDIPDEMTFKDGMEFYRKLHDAYGDTSMTYDEFNKFKNRLVDVIVKGLLKESPIEKLAEEWFKDYGTMNGWGWKTSFRYSIACKLHSIHKEKHPDEHHAVPQKKHWSGWYEDNCSCGLCSSSDSSD